MKTIATILALILLLPSTFSLNNNNDIESWYEKAVQAQNTGQYYNFIQEASNNKRLFSDYLVQTLDELKRGQNSDLRQEVFTSIIKYYSNKHEKYKSRAIDLLSQSEYSFSDLKNGNYDSQRLAQSLVASISSYEKEVTAFILNQIEEQVRVSFPKSMIFSIGRDFTKAHLYFNSRNLLNPSNMYTANISRMVRDAVFDGQYQNMKAYMKSIGITAKKVMKKGIVFMDSSMSGKIPRSIIYSLAADLNDSDRYEFLRKCYFLYLNSTDRSEIYANQEKTAMKGTFSEVVEETSSGTKQISQSQLNDLVKYFSSMVPRFQVVLPKSHKGWPARHHHNLFEHSFKALQSSTGFDSQELDIPRAKGDILKELEFSLGIISEIEISEIAKNHQLNQTFDYTRDGVYLKEVFERIDRVHQGGFDQMRDWQYLPYPGAQEMAERVQVNKLGDNQGYSFTVDGEEIMKLKRKISEGRNLVVYETYEGDALKLVKESKQVRKNFMLAWMQQKMDQYKLTYAPIKYIHPTGLWLIQEFIPAESMEYFYYDHYNKQKAEGLPEHIRDQVVTQWERSYKMAQDLGIWLDFKAANFVYNIKTNKIVNVDYVPRLNKGYWTYFLNQDTNEKISVKKMLKRFLGHDIEKGKLKKKPKRASCYSAFSF